MDRQERAEAYVRVADLLSEACIQLDALAASGPSSAKTVPNSLKHALAEPLAAIRAYARSLRAEPASEPKPALCPACGWVGLAPAPSGDCPFCGGAFLVDPVALFAQMARLSTQRLGSESVERSEKAKGGGRAKERGSDTGRIRLG